MTVRIGLLTIGQTPRTDITSEIAPYLPHGVELIEVGVLDEFTTEEVSRKFQPGPTDVIYITRMRDSSQVMLGRDKIVGIMQEKIHVLNRAGVDIIILLCSGEFPHFHSDAPIVYPDRVLKGVVSSLSFDGKAAVLIPLPEQVDYAKGKWSGFLKELEVLPISPYVAQMSDFEKVGHMLRDRIVRLVVMDCLGYTLMQRKLVMRKAGCPAISSRSVLIKCLLELIA